MYPVTPPKPARGGRERWLGCGDRRETGYVLPSTPLFDALYERGVQLITRLRKNMKNKLLPLVDKLLLRKRALIESVNDQLKNISQIEHTRHRTRATS
jgi:hypothetical protein